MIEVAVVLETGEDGWITAECPSFPGCISQGRTEEEALANIKKAMVGWFLVEAEKQRDAATGQDWSRGGESLRESRLAAC